MANMRVECQVTSHVSPLLNNFFKSPSPLLRAGRDLVVEQLVVLRSIDVAEHADRLGELGVPHAAEQVGQASARRLSRRGTADRLR